MVQHHDTNHQERQSPVIASGAANHRKPRPTIIIIPGAWHQPVHYTALAEPLRQRGYKVEVAALSTMGDPDAIRAKTHHDDVEIVRALLEPHLAAGREVVLVGHSYGGLVATDTAAGFTVEERGAVPTGPDGGLQVQGGGVRAVVYIASPAVVEKGISLTSGMEKMSMGDPPANEGKVTLEDGVAKTSDECWKHLYSPADEKVSRAAFAASRRHHSVASFLSASAAGARDLRARLAYVVAAADEFTLSPAVQHRIADGMGPRCTKHVFEGAGHAPWLQPELLPRLVGVVTGVAED
ncbi:hypothetical protein MGG_10555 [Pyricularia oryzae 70-15]|uniref:AB hydrolase-1 domain-containing protein n=3 Tax=Pyricularia oryzae TaxID=318829 RepID=G5EHZ4_PYRO7|nr:uncharacterized protein MGG_10555 [Pyricularia oryzae 70-15]ELQ36587.1 hypothetical protein OOU_Y34scaffold00652g2 [Pyricularia oryzae Y34]KAI7909708.1 hypothetical protein M9X92_011490 [Pyricularia oryzae]EAQ70695.1 hypothetical protein MGCH7_ch7g102 [Pyricularia oryzae 70-15]EHA46658.1 hypothetical protein MGG_10555 [Pyricularia oryzae 70-15]KAI7910955.1 hypothetical protein M0657_011169 [Pyricularia oryzae]